MFVRLTRSAALVALLLSASPAFAADWYSEVAYGRADFGADFGSTPDAYSVGFGVLFNDHFGAQFDWAYTGTPSPAACPVPICLIPITPEHMTSLRVLGRLPLGDRFEVIGGFGRVRSNNSAYDFTHYSDEISLSVGWRINEIFTLSIQRQTASVNDFAADDAAIDTVTLRYRF